MAEKTVIASGNADKILEIKLALGDLAWEFTDLKSCGNFPEPEETGTTFAANARIKARYYQKLTGLSCLADDSGLSVDALGGFPGVRSARFAGDHLGDAANNAKLVAEMGRIGLNESSAHYTCVLALVRADGEEILAEGELHGTIKTVARGSGGFGYDPYFYLPDGRTLAEVTRAEKNTFSHRGRALANLLTKLQTKS